MPTVDIPRPKLQVLERIPHPTHPKLQLQRRSTSPFWQAWCFHDSQPRLHSTRTNDFEVACERASAWFLTLGTSADNWTPSRGTVSKDVFTRARRLVGAAAKRAKAKGTACTVTEGWVAKRLRTGRCEVTDLPFDFTARGSGHSSNYAPSLDQIVPGKGYTPENTQVVVWMYNSAKWQGTHGDVLKMAFALVNKASQPIIKRAA